MTVTFLHGDCLSIMPALEADSIDACVTDPPYHLTTGKKGGTGEASLNLNSPAGRSRVTTGLMGQKWDGGDVAFRVETWAEVFRVLKPGAHLLAFSGTRTYHRMVCAIEDAGFEVRDQIGWLYGCLDQTSEILTADGWKRGVDVAPGDLVAAWDHVTGDIALRPVLETFRAPFTGRMVAFRNDNTDQLLTPNHRVYARHSQRKMVDGVRSRWFDPVWTVAEAGAVNRWNPIQLPLAGRSSGEGIGGTDYAALLGWIWTEGGFDRTGNGVRIYQSESANPDKVAEIHALMARLVPRAKRYDRERDYTHAGVSRKVSESCWFFTGDVASRVRADLPGKKPTWPLLWKMTASEKEAFLDAAMKGDGSGTAFYQNCDACLEWFQALLHLTGRQGRINKGKRCVSVHDNPTTELQARHLRHDGEDYTGDVWCVRVETGAFVARRNGFVFITGNSGFPKSHNLSGDWQGWGTALKPAWEPIVVARKPLIDTVAANVLAHGTGALNIGGCRVPCEGGSPSIQPRDVEKMGRWPANIVHDGSDEVLAEFAKYGESKSSDRERKNGEFKSVAKGRELPHSTFGHNDTGTAARFFYCAKASKAERAGSKHPTVKPVALMRWLVRLVTPPGGTVLDPFAGSGTTGAACVAEGFRAVLIEREKEYVADIRRRLAEARGPLFQADTP